MSVRVSYPRLISVNHAAGGLVTGGGSGARISAGFYFGKTARDRVRLMSCDVDDSIAVREQARDNGTSLKTRLPVRTRIRLRYDTD